MTKSILLRGAALFFAAVAPVVVCAQFQQPTDEELKMTADSKAPGAAAVYLDIKEVENDSLHYRSLYRRIKVLTEKGKELATVQLPYLQGDWKVTDIKARTIHPDGAIFPLAIKPEDLMIVKSGDLQANKKVFTLPNVEVGSILEYYYEIHYNWFEPPQWTVRQSYFVHKAHYEFTAETALSLGDAHGHIMRRLLWWPNLPEGVAVKSGAGGRLTLDITDIPPSPDEEWMPPIQSLLYRVGFFYSDAVDSHSFWLEAVKLWSKDVDQFAGPSKTMKDVVAGLNSPNDSGLDEAKKLYIAVQALDNTDFSRKKSESEMKELKIKEIKDAKDTWEQKSGSSEDIAMLYLSMLRAAGLTAYAVKVVDRDRDLFDPAFMSLEQLDSTLVALSVGGKEILLDPGEKMCPFQTVSWKHSDAAGVGQSAQGPSLISTPEQQYKDNVTQRLGDVFVDAQGGVTGRVNIVMNGQKALHWRQRALVEDDTELKKEFDHEEIEGLAPEGVDAHVDHFLSMNDPYSDLMAAVTVKGTLGTATAKRLILPGFFFETRAAVPFVNEDKRLIPVDMHYGRRVTDEITYHLPDGVSVEGAPQDASIPWPSHAAFIAKSVAQPGQITVRQTLLVGFTIAKPEEYQDLRGFYQKVAGADQEQLVLTMPAAPAPSGKTAAPAGGGN